MAAYQVEQALCHGRGFEAPAGIIPGGFMYVLENWMLRSAALGGWGGYLHDDRRAITPDPYLVFSTHNAAGPNVPAKYIQVLLPTATGSQLRIMCWLYWDNVNHQGFGPYGAFNLRTDDSIDFIYDFRGGPEFLALQTLTTAATWEGFWIDEIALDSNLIDNVSATTTVTNFVGADLQFRGIDFATGMTAALDGSGNTYGRIAFVSGTTWTFKLYSNSARTVEVATGSFSTLTTSANQVQLGLSAVGGSGVTANVFLQGPTVADATILFRPNKITLGSGEAAAIVPGNFYFIYDLTVRNAVNSVKVISKAGDELTVDRVYRPFPLGSKLVSYAHTFFCAGTGGSLMAFHASIPYFNVLGSMTNYVGTNGACEQTSLLYPFSGWASGFSIDPTVYLSTDDPYLTTMTPDRKGNYAVQRPGVAEYKSFGISSNSRNGITGYGQLKNVIICPVSTMSPNIHGRKLSGIDYIYFRAQQAYIGAGANNFAMLFRDSIST